MLKQRQRITNWGNEDYKGKISVRHSLKLHTIRAIWLGHVSRGSIMSIYTKIHLNDDDACG